SSGARASTQRTPTRWPPRARTCSAFRARSASACGRISDMTPGRRTHGGVVMKVSRFTWIALLLLLVASVVAAATTPLARWRARPAAAHAGPPLTRIDINDISMVVKNTGSFAYDTQAGSAGLEFPKGTGKTAVFAAGIWMGAQVAGKLRVSVAEYSDDYKPGAAVGGVPENPSDPALK